MQKNDKFLGILGLSRRAGKIILGAAATQGMRGQAKLVILAKDASQNTENDVLWLCEKHKIKFIKTDYTKEELGGACGYKQAAVVTVTDSNFVKTLLNISDISEVTK